jgi:hypothetical protein
MKTIIISTILSLTTMTSCTTDPNVEHQSVTVANSSEEMAKQVINALQHSSSQNYVALFPTLQEFHQMMEKNSSLYGESLSSAKQDFATTYESDLIPTVKKSFDRIVAEGKKKGIEWNTIRFERIESIETMEQQFATAPVTIVFNSNGKEYKLILEKALLMHAQWKVSQFIKLV